MITVMKFGGSSVGSAEAVRRSADIIINNRHSTVVVLSAMSGVTNYLIGRLEAEDGSHVETVDALRLKHREVAEELLSEPIFTECCEELDRRLASLEALLSDPAARDDPYFQDDISSQGERLSTVLLSCYLRELGHGSVALTSEEAGIHAVGLPGLGSADLVATCRDLQYKVMPLLNQKQIPIITGFYGRSPEGRPLTFGRGGSDYSSAVVAHALDADCLEIWTDVDGFMSSDPRLVPSARTIEEMNYSEAAELAYFGAKVLHPRTIEPVRRKHIPLKVKNSFDPNAPGTVIHHLRAPREDLLLSVALKTDLSIITVNSAEIAYRPRIVARIIDKIADAGVILYAISTSLSTIALLIHNLDVKETLRHLNSLEGDEIDRIDVKSNMCLICAVGDNLLARCGASAEIFGAVRDAEANVELISEGASDVSLNFVVPVDQAAAVNRLLHERYIGV